MQILYLESEAIWWEKMHRQHIAMDECEIDKEMLSRFIDRNVRGALESKTTNAANESAFLISKPRNVYK